MTTKHNPEDKSDAFLSSDNPIMTVSETAQLLRITVATVYAWVHERRIPHRHHGRRLVFARKDIERWSQSQAVTAREPLTFSIDQVNQPKRNQCIRSKHASVGSLKTERTADVEPIFSNEKEN